MELADSVALTQFEGQSILEHFSRHRPVTVLYCNCPNSWSLAVFFVRGCTEPINSNHLQLGRHFLLELVISEGLFDDNAVISEALGLVSGHFS